MDKRFQNHKGGPGCRLGFSLLKFLLICFFGLALFSCDKIKRKRDLVIDRTREKINEAKNKLINKKEQLLEKVDPSYDYDQPDTDHNKKRFKEHLQVELTEDIKNIYAYGDFLGIDYKVLLTFTCDPITIDKIIAVKKMELTTSKLDQGLMFSVNLKWWDTNRMDSLQPFKSGKEGKYWQYLWYDRINKMAYYEEYSL